MPHLAEAKQHLIYTPCRMPLLYGSLTGGRFLTILFFLCISLAGLSSLIALLEQAVHVLEDFGCEFVTNRNVLPSSREYKDDIGYQH